jgi:hypothetical protein
MTLALDLLVKDKAESGSGLARIVLRWDIVQILQRLSISGIGSYNNDALHLDTNNR